MHCNGFNQRAVVGGSDNRAAGSPRVQHQIIEAKGDTQNARRGIRETLHRQGDVLGQHGEGHLPLSHSILAVVPENAIRRSAQPTGGGRPAHPHGWSGSGRPDVRWNACSVHPHWPAAWVSREASGCGGCTPSKGTRPFRIIAMRPSRLKAWTTTGMVRRWTTVRNPGRRESGEWWVSSLWMGNHDFVGREVRIAGSATSRSLRGGPSSRSPPIFDQARAFRRSSLCSTEIDPLSHALNDSARGPWAAGLCHCPRRIRPAFPTHRLRMETVLCTGPLPFMGRPLVLDRDRSTPPGPSISMYPLPWSKMIRSMAVDGAPRACDTPCDMHLGVLLPHNVGVRGGSHHRGGVQHHLVVQGKSCEMGVVRLHIPHEV